MIKTLRIVATILALSAGAASAQQILPSCGYNSRVFGGCAIPPDQGGTGGSSKTQVYSGLQLTFGSGAAPTPKLVVGVRHTKASGDKVYGADASVRIGFRNGLKLDSSVLSLVGGNTDILANAGIGYSFAEKSMMTVGALEAAHIRAGADYVFSLSSPSYFIEANTIK